MVKYKLLMELNRKEIFGEEILDAEKEQPLFENRGNFSYHYEITENDIIIFHVKTAVYVL